MKFFILIVLFFSSCSIAPDKEPRQVYYVKSAGAELPVVIAGNKDSKNIIMYIHGGPGASGIACYYTKAFTTLRQDHKMVFYDQRGSGGARGHIPPESITIDQHVKDMDAVVNSVKTLYPNAKIYLIGHSYGGMVSGAYTSVYGNKITGLLLLSPAINFVDMANTIPSHFIDSFIDPYLSGNISSEDRKYWEEAKRFYQNNSPMQLESLFQHGLYVSVAEPLQGIVQEEYHIAKYLADPLLEIMIFGTQIEIMLPIMVANGEDTRNLETDPKFNLRNITIPTHLITGTKDLQMPSASSIQSYAVIGSSRKTTENFDVGHNMFREQADKFVVILKKFIRDNP